MISLKCNTIYQNDDNGDYYDDDNEESGCWSFPDKKQKDNRVRNELDLAVGQAF